MTLLLAEIQRFCMHDGPGLRTTLFLKGCPLRCAWCHNPETQRPEPELLFYATKCLSCGACVARCPAHAQQCTDAGRRIDRSRCTACGQCADDCWTGALALSGQRYAIPELMAVLERDRAFYGAEGGVTLSGGEPLMQPEGCLALLHACRDAGISTAIETCGQFDPAILPELVPLVDCFLWDIKDTDSARHRRMTGVGTEQILANLHAADALGARTRLRCILVNTVNAEETHYQAVHALRRTLHGCTGVEWLPYHAYAGTKATFLGRPDNGRTDWLPTDAQLERARQIT